MGSRTQGSAGRGAAGNYNSQSWRGQDYEQAAYNSQQQALADGNTFMPNVTPMAEPATPAAPAQTNQYYGGGMFNISPEMVERARQYAAGRYGNPVAPPPAAEATPDPVAEPTPPPAASTTTADANGWQSGGILDNLYGNRGYVAPTENPQAAAQATQATQGTQQNVCPTCGRAN